MDRFVTRQPSWKTVSYDVIAAAQVNRAAMDNKNKDKVRRAPVEIKKPLQEQDLRKNVLVGRSSRRLSMLDEQLKQIFTRPEKIHITRRDSTYSTRQNCTPKTNICQAENSQLENYSGKLSDYVSREPSDSQGRRGIPLTISLTPSPSNPIFDELIRSNLKDSQILQTPPFVRMQGNMRSDTPQKHTTQTVNNSSQFVYSINDTTKQEQNFFAEKCNTTDITPPTIQELMRNVIVYVEVRTGEDNRSAGIKKVIAALGAKVNDKLLRDTTHVIFKDGLLSTYKKAKNWNIPIVSILWIEACKDQCRICDPKEFPISNLDRYENPELYEKMKRQKSMQPDSECNKRVRVRPATGSTPKTPKQTTAGTVKKTTTLNNGETPTTASNKKTDIRNHFKGTTRNKLLENVDDFSTPKSGTEYNSGVVDSPATDLLKRIQSNSFIPITPLALGELVKWHDVDDNTSVEQNNNKVVDEPSKPASGQDKGEEQTTTANPLEGTGLMQANIDATTLSIEEMSISKGPVNEMMTDSPKMASRRRFIQVDSSLSDDNVKTDRSSTSLSYTSAKSSSDDAAKDGCLTKQVSGRRTSLRNKSIDVSPEPTGNVEEKSKDANTIDATTAATMPTTTATTSTTNRRRRTLYTPVNMDATLEQGMHSAGNANPSAKNAPAPNRRRTLYTPCRMEETLVEKKEEKQKRGKASPTTKETATTSRRRVLYTPKKVNSSLFSKKSPTTPPRGAIGKNNNINSNDKSRKQQRNEPDKTPIQRRDAGTPFKSPRALQKQIKRNPNSGVEVPAVDSTTAQAPQAAKIVTESMEKEANHSKTSKTMREGAALVDTFEKQKKQSVKCSRSDSCLPSNLISTPISPHAASTTRLHNETPLTPLNKQAEDLLVEEHNGSQKLTFSSTRKAALSKRRSLFDISMDIITERLQNINRSARRSVAPSQAPVTEEFLRNLIDQDRPNSQRKNGIETLKSAQTQTSAIISTTPAKDQVAEKCTPIVNKKRKLFVPDSSFASPVSNLAGISSDPSNSSQAAAIKSVKRRRTLMGQSQPLPPSTAKTPVPATRTRRRSTFDFVNANAVEQPTVSHATSAQATKAANRNAAPTSVAHASKAKKASTKDSAKNSTCENVALVVVKHKKKPCMVYTNMHKEQADIICEAIRTLGEFDLEDNVDEKTTHLVSLEPRRTLNMLRGLSRGIWILEYTWILDSLKLGSWANEEGYELKDFSRAVEICRAERQAFGNAYKCELFSNLEPFYISSRCGHVSKNDLSELITLCGGKIVDQRKRGKYILGNANRLLEDKVYITPYWILDSITQMQLQKFHRYTFPSDMPKSTLTQAHTQPYQTLPHVQLEWQKAQDDLEPQDF